MQNTAANGGKYTAKRENRITSGKMNEKSGLNPPEGKKEIVYFLG
jgi:hypothetical protein